MVTVDETARALEGILRIALFDRAGIGSFGRDYNACARSFWAYAIALPATLLLLAIDLSFNEIEHPVLYAVSQLISDVIAAVGFPLLLLPLFGWLARRDRWAWFVTSYNWYSMAVAIATVTMLGILSNVPGSELRGVLLGATQIYFIVLEAFLADAILGIGAWRAGLVVLVDLGLQFGVIQIANWIAS